MSNLIPFSRKRNAKGVVVTPAPSSCSTSSEDHFWDCSVCTYRNNAEAFKCSMCDVRKGTSTRKPKINPDLVASQLAQALTPPPPPITPTPSCSNSLHEGDEDPYQFDEESTVLATLKSKKVPKEKSAKKKEPGSTKKSAASG